MEKEEIWQLVYIKVAQAAQLLQGRRGAAGQRDRRHWPRRLTSLRPLHAPSLPFLQQSTRIQIARNPCGER
jgi:hypothetical protein